MWYIFAGTFRTYSTASITVIMPQFGGSQRPTWDEVIEEDIDATMYVTKKEVRSKHTMP